MLTSKSLAELRTASRPSYHVPQVMALLANGTKSFLFQDNFLASLTREEVGGWIVQALWLMDV